jgi:hypothetical protein
MRSYKSLFPPVMVYDLSLGDLLNTLRILGQKVFSMVTGMAGETTSEETSEFFLKKRAICLPSSWLAELSVPNQLMQGVS